ncbi:MAG: serine/threonine-protein kinase [Kofleriaceae bacterium]
MSRALGRYELLRPLAKGGMAEVFLARRRAAGVEKWLVVKRIRAERATDVQFLELFVREARLSMSLAHQNIVPVFDFGRIDDQVFLAMERVEGKDLNSCLARAATLPTPAPLSPLLSAFVAAECCQALDYAHRRKSPEGTALGIVHRDVTPRNVLLSWSGEVKLTDFGIAALAGDATTALLGTPAYMAPEQARRETLDARTDVYAVGLVLREMLTGQRARAGADRESFVGAARTGELLPWPAHDVPPSLVAIVDKATAATPSDRHTDARALLAELDEFLVGERAAKKVDAPARQLAAWLDRVWGTHRDEDAGTSGELPAHEGSEFVSFLDDGALDIAGTGTQRSMLATAAEDVASISPFDDTMAAAAKRNSKRVEVPAVDEADAKAPSVDESTKADPSKPDASKPDATKVDASTPVATKTAASKTEAGQRGVEVTSVERPARSGAWRWLAVALAAIIAMGVLFFQTRGENRATDNAIATTDGAIALTDGAIAMTDAAIAHSADGDIAMMTDAGAIDGAIATDAAIAVADASIATARDANTFDASTTASDASVPLARDASVSLARDAAVRDTPPLGRDASVSTTPRDAGATARRVTITSRPWSNFRVDDDPTEYETPATVTLSPGPHRIHFHNPELKLTKEITIDVPADRDLKHVENLP